jgi:hypothetical protein
VQILTFKKHYFAWASLIFLIEVLIALFVHDQFVRPYVGDVLVVILLYCFIRAFLNFSVSAVAFFVLAFSFTLEFLQYFNLVGMLGLQNSKIARTVIGTSFAWYDLVAYSVGIAIVLIIEHYRIKRRMTTTEP